MLLTSRSFRLLCSSAKANVPSSSTNCCRQKINLMNKHKFWATKIPKQKLKSNVTDNNTSNTGAHFLSSAENQKILSAPIKR